MIRHAFAHRYVAPSASVLLLIGLFVEHQAFHLPPGDPGPYHASVRAAVEQLPEHLGEWRGEDVLPPSSAVKMLRPNVLLGREFRNVATGEKAMLVLVQCQDARDLGGHWPPVCYPAHGWTLQKEGRRDVSVDGTSTPVMTHTFSVESLGSYSEVTIYSFFALPGEALEAGLDGVRRAAESRRMRGYGAAQVQVVFSTTMTWEDMDRAFALLVGGARPFVLAVQDWERA